MLSMVAGLVCLACYLAHATATRASKTKPVTCGGLFSKVFLCYFCLYFNATPAIQSVRLISLPTPCQELLEVPSSLGFSDSVYFCTAPHIEFTLKIDQSHVPLLLNLAKDTVLPRTAPRLWRVSLTAPRRSNDELRGMHYKRFQTTIGSVGLVTGRHLREICLSPLAWHLLPLRGPPSVFPSHPF